MGLYKTITDGTHTKVLIWKVEETEEELRQGILLTEGCRIRLADMRSELHRRGFLSVRQLLQKAGYTVEDLYYDDWGKPHLRDGTYISITHSYIFAGIALSQFPVGIDIELQRPKITQIARKFCGYEWEYLDADDVRRLTLIWCIKEGLYKLFAKTGLSFKDHCKVVPFHPEDQQGIAWIQFRRHVEGFRAGFFEFEGFSCAWILPKNTNVLP